MPSAQEPNNDKERLEALYSYDILDTAEEKDFDDLVELASVICQTPIALISLVDKNRQWFKAHKGLPIRETGRDVSFCAHAIGNPGEVMIVDDPKHDPRFSDNPLVTGELNINFYAGVPLIDDNGYALGSLCVIDQKQHVLSQEQINALRIISTQVIEKLRLRRQTSELILLNKKLIKSDANSIGQNENLLLANKKLNATNASQLEENQQLSISNDEHIALNKKLNGAITELNRMAEERKQLNEELAATNEELNVANEEMTSLNEELAVINEEISSLNEEYTATNENLVSLNIERDKLNEELQKKNAALATLNKEHQAANDQLQLLNDKYLELNDQLNIKNTELNTLNNERQTLNEELTTTNEELQSMNAEFEVLNEELQSTNEELHSLNDAYILLNDKVTVALETANLAKSAASLGTFDLDIINDKLDWDDRCKELFGLSPDVTVTYTSDFVNGLHPDDKKRILKAVADAYNFDVSKGNYDVNYRTIGAEDKKLRWVRAIGKVLFTKEKEPRRFIGTVIDITEQKEDEQRKNDFIGMVSHELKTPLTSLNGYLQVMQTRNKKTEDSFSAGMLERSVAQIKKMTSMINGFLNVSRFESGKIHIDKQVFDMAELVIEAEEESTATITTHKVSFHPVEKTMITADRDKIGQVITNFINNAAKYSPQGSTINVACVTTDNIAKVTVTDQGMGISKTDLNKLFDRYYRVEGTHMKSISGFGIGLYLSSEIIKRHGGNIGVESELGKGSKFWFTLPLA